jgi:hypothetical protein
MTEAKEKSCIPELGNQPVGDFQSPSGPFLKIAHTRRHSSIQDPSRAQRSLWRRFVRANGGDILVCCGTFSVLRTRMLSTESVEYIPLIATLRSAGIRLLTEHAQSSERLLPCVKQVPYVPRDHVFGRRENGVLQINSW